MLSSAFIIRMEIAVIVLDLICAEGHGFEGWFASLEAFEQQHAKQLVSCPRCACQNIRRRPSAPHVAAARHKTTATPATSAAEPLLAQLIDTLRKLSTEAEDVGARFTAEARKIHHGDAEPRAIKGQTTLDDALSLLEEGISVMPLPAAKEDLH